MSAKITVIGNLGDNPVENSAQSGDVVNFSVCSNEYDPKQGGKIKVWYKVHLFENDNPKLYTQTTKYLQKGSRIDMLGKFMPKTWVNNKGETITDMTVSLLCWEFCGGVKKKETSETLTEESYRQGYGEPTQEEGILF